MIEDGTTVDRQLVRLDPWSVADLPMLQECNTSEMTIHVGGPETGEELAERQANYEKTDSRQYRTILGADDRVTESIKWKTPTFAFEGNIASFNPSKNAVSIMFHRGAEIPGKHPRLEGDGKLVRTMRFEDLDDVGSGRADLERVIRAWCELKGGAR